MAISNSQLAIRMESLLQSWTRRERQYRDWLGGTPTGGPNGDGRYELTDGLGRTYLVACPALLADGLAGPAATAQAALVAAEAARDQSLNEATRAEAERVLAEAAASTANKARDQAEAASSRAQNAEANAQVHRQYAEQAREGTAEDAHATSVHRDDAQYAAAWAENWGVEAQAAAERAGNYDPALYATRKDGLTQIVGLQDALNAKLAVSGFTWDALPGKPSVMRTDVVNTITGGRGGTEGGEFRLAQPASGTTMLAPLTVDLYGDQLRIFEGGQNGSRGFYLDMTQAQAGVGSRIWHSGNFNPADKANALHSHAEYALVSGAQTLTGEKTFSNPHVRHIGRTDRPAVIHRHDGTNYWHLLTDPTDPSGTYNGLRPFKLDTATGHITLGEGAQINKGLTVNGGLAVDGKTALVGANASDAVLTSETNLGRTGNSPLITGTRDAAWWGGLPTGYSTMVNLLPANGAPANGHGFGYFFKMARRDNSNGWSGLWTNHGGSYRRLFVGFANDQGVMPSWNEVWTDGNFDPNAKANLAGGNAFTGVSKFKNSGEPGLQIMQEDEQTAMRFGPAGGISFKTNGVWQSPHGNIKDLMFCRIDQWNNSTDGYPRFLFAGQSRTYIRGYDGIEFRNAADVTTLFVREDGNLIGTGEVFAGIDRWFRVRGNTGIYWENHGGGWTMRDSTWMRSFNDKHVFTGGRMRADQGFYVGDLRQPVIRSGTAAPSGGSDGDLYVQF